MTDLTAKIFRLTINGVNWTDYCTDATLQWDELDLISGLVFAKASFTLDVSELSPLPSYRTDPDQWAKGTAVLFECQNSIGVHVTPRFGQLFILEVPAAASKANPFIELTCGCSLSLFDFGVPDGDVSGVTVGTPRDRQLIIADVLAENGLPENLGAIPYPIDYPVPKQSGSWVEQAGKVAGAASHFLWQDNNLDIVNKAIALNPAAIQTVTIGTNESEWEPSEGAETPAEKLIISGVSYSVAARSGSTTISEILGYKRDVYPNVFTDAYIGVIERTTVTDGAYDVGTKSQTTVTLLEQCKATLWIGTSVLFNDSDDSIYDLTTASKSTDINYYDDDGKLIRQVCTVEKPMVSIIDFVTELSPNLDLYVAEITTTEYFYGSDAKVNRLKITTQLPKGTIAPSWIVFNAFLYADALTLQTAKINESTWTELGSNRWLYVQTERVAYGAKYPNGGGFGVLVNDPIAFSLVPNPTKTFLSDDGTGAPPQTQYLTLNDLTETPVTACVYFQGLEANPYGDRSATIAVEYATSESQLQTFGTNYNALVWGRRYGWRVGLPISDTLLAAEPLSRINVVDGAQTYGLLMDGLTMVFTASECFAVFNGIEIAIGATPSYKIVVAANGALSIPVTLTSAGETSGNVANLGINISMSATAIINPVEATAALTIPVVLAGSATVV